MNNTVYHRPAQVKYIKKILIINYKYQKKMKWGPIKELVFIAVGKQNLPGDSTKLLLKSFISCDISKCDKGFYTNIEGEEQ